jgi:hypothetical protein
LLAVTALMAGAASPAQAATPIFHGTGWRKGNTANVSTPCFFSGISYTYCTGMMSRLDYRNPSGNVAVAPYVGQTFTLHLYIAVPAPDSELISGFFQPRLRLPAGLKLAATAANPVRCIFSDLATDTTSGKAPCGLHQESAAQWRIDSAHLVNHLVVHYFVPVVATKAFNGAATDDCSTTAVINRGVCIQATVTTPFIALVSQNFMVSAVPLKVWAKSAPGAPDAPAATSRNGAASVSWKAPARTGGSAVKKYVVTASPGGRTCATTGALSCMVTGLKNGGVYTFTVKATNASGTGAASKPSVRVKVGTPTAPRSPSVTHSGAGQATIKWLAPASAGSAPILRYEMNVRATTDGVHWTAWSGWTSVGTSLKDVEPGLPIAVYEVQVRAVNKTGAGAPLEFAFAQVS